MINSLWENILKPREKDTSSILKENILFQDLSSKELKFVTNIVHLRKYREREVIFHHGEAGVGMYIIAEGSVNITIEDSHAESDADHNEIIITKLGEGDFFGEISLIEENGRRSATATALEKTTLIGFFKPDLFEILERNPRAGIKISLRLCEVLSRRLKETTEKASLLEKQIKQLQKEKDK